MDDTTLILLRDAVIQLVQNCMDADLLDLICKLLIESDTSHGSDYTID